MKLKNEFEKLLDNGKYHIPIRKNKKINQNNYYKNAVDPDGKKRILKNEKAKTLKQFKVILDFLKKNKKGGKILDIGCGFGWMLSSLNKKKWETHGVELDKDCKEIAEKNMDRFYSNLSKIKQKKFDVITMIHVIEHLRNPEMKCEA